MKISKVVKFKYIYVFIIWNKIDILVSSKKKNGKKNGAAFIEARAV